MIILLKMDLFSSLRKLTKESFDRRPRHPPRPDIWLWLTACACIQHRNQQNPIITNRPSEIVLKTWDCGLWAKVWLRAAAPQDGVPCQAKLDDKAKVRPQTHAHSNRASKAEFVCKVLRLLFCGLKPTFKAHLMFLNFLLTSSVHNVVFCPVCRVYNTLNESITM